MTNRWRGASHIVDNVRSSPALLGSAFAVIGVLALTVGLVVGDVLAPAPGTPSPGTGSGEEGDAERDNPEGFAAWLFGGSDEEPAVDQYLEAERELRERLAIQAQLEEQGDDRALVLKGLGATSQSWTWLGPRNQGGRTRALVVSPTDPNIMLAGGITGGIWRSENRGASWVPLTDTFSNIAINVIEIDPSNPLVVYAGTGEAFYRFWPRHRGNGIMKSTDGGISWAFLESTTVNDAFDWVGDIEVSHHDSNRVYAATGMGVWVSDDGGASWGAGPTLPASDPRGVGCLELAIRTDLEPDVVFASCGHSESADGAYRSTNGGATWEPILPVTGERVGVISLAIAPSDQNLVFASVGTLSCDGPPPCGGGNALGLFASVQGGAPGSWELRASPATRAPNWYGYCEEPEGDGQGGYVTSLAVDPTDPNRLWVGGIDLYRSDDGGRTFRNASHWRFGDGDPRYVHADQHEIVFDPQYDGTSNRTVYFAHDGGLSRTTDDRAPIEGECRQTSGVAFESLNNGYGITQFVGGSVSADGRLLVGGTQDNGTFALQAAGTTTDWASIWWADGGNSALHPAGEWVMATTYYGAFYRLTGTARTQYSDDCWATGECKEVSVDHLEKVFDFYPPIEQDAANVIWTAGQTTLWRSRDVGESWEPAGQPGSWVSAIAFAPGDPGSGYVGTYGGLVSRSTNLGDQTPTWTEVGDFPNHRVSSIAVDPSDPRTVFVAFKTFDGQQLWRSRGGEPFEPIDADLPETPVNTIAINPRNPAMVYVGTDVGVFESLDGGDTWRVANENLATTIISRLVFRTGTSDLYAFTFGRGAYRVDVGDRIPPINDLIASATEVALAPDYRDVIDIRSASISSGDPALSCGSSLAPAQTRSVWYRLVGVEGRLAVSTDGSNFDTVVAVHAASADGHLTEVACNDESVAALGPSSLVFDAEAGKSYYVEVTRSASSPTDTLANRLELTIRRP